MPLDTQTAGDVIGRHQSSVPVDVESIARELGIAVHYAELGRDVAGKIVRDRVTGIGGRSGFAVIINSSDPPRRQRFTLAHEIAHYVLHRDMIGDGIIDSAMYRSSLSDWNERQANRMAADILLPAQAVRAAFRQDPAIVRMAARFDVSEAAMKIRLAELRLGA